jgi:hypothetical protein
MFTGAVERRIDRCHVRNAVDLAICALSQPRQAVLHSTGERLKSGPDGAAVGGRGVGIGGEESLVRVQRDKGLVKGADVPRQSGEEGEIGRRE